MTDAVADVATADAAVAAAHVDADPARIDALIEEMQVGHVDDSELVPADFVDKRRVCAIISMYPKISAD